jgi:HKD family nuclease
MEFIFHPNDKYRLGDFLNDSLADPQWTVFRATVAFIKRSGTKHIRNSLVEFVNRGGKVVITGGVDVGGTTAQALEDLLSAVKGSGQLFVFHNSNGSTFHPKLFLFRNDMRARIVVGSANLTEGGLFTNYEACLQIQLEISDKTDAKILAQVETLLDEWSNPKSGLCREVTPELIQQLILENLLPDEAVMRVLRKDLEAARQRDKVGSIFRAQVVPAAPRIRPIESELPLHFEIEDQAVPGSEEEDESLEVEAPPPTIPQPGRYSIFLMTLQKTDVGVGQTTKGTQRRSPEIFIPLICRNFDPEFWGWPNGFIPDHNWSGTKDANGFGKMDRTNVMVRLGGEIFPVSIWYNPDKRDIRIRSEHIRKAGAIGDILYLERADGTAGYSYYVEIIPQGSLKYPEYIALCTKAVVNSKKLWNYL